VIPVGIVEDHPVTQLGLVGMVTAHPLLELEAIADCFEDTARWADPIPAVVLLDLGLPGICGPDAVTALRRRGASVLVLSAFGRREDVVSAMEAGASGYLTKQTDPEEIAQAVCAVATGETFVSPTLAGFLLREARAGGGSDGLDLTQRESEVLCLVAQGEADSDIAATLEISVRTVHAHLRNIRDKTGLRRRSELTRLAVAHGVVPAVERRQA
jgi:DNA-binding NarL/FixJ family response regulator